MKNKLLAAACAVSVLASAAALAAALTSRARAAEPAPEQNMTLIGRDHDTDVFLVRHDGISCFVASTRAGSGISINCQH